MSRTLLPRPRPRPPASQRAVGSNGAPLLLGASRSNPAPPFAGYKWPTARGPRRQAQSWTSCGRTGLRSGLQPRRCPQAGMPSWGTTSARGACNSPPRPACTPGRLRASCGTQAGQLPASMECRAIRTPPAWSGVHIASHRASPPLSPPVPTHAQHHARSVHGLTRMDSEERGRSLRRELLTAPIALMSAASLRSVPG